MKKALGVIACAMTLTACEGKIPADQIVFGANQCKKHDGLDYYTADGVTPGNNNVAVCKDGVQIDLRLLQRNKSK